jgi:hypothetical protein
VLPAAPGSESANTTNIIYDLRFHHEKDLQIKPFYLGFNKARKPTQALTIIRFSITVIKAV